MRMGRAWIARMEISIGEGDDDTGLAAAWQAVPCRERGGPAYLVDRLIQGGEHGSLSRDELHDAAGLHAGAAGWRNPAIQWPAVPTHDRRIDDAGGDPHAIAGDLPALVGPAVAQRARAGGKPVRAGLQPPCRAAPRAPAAHASAGAAAIRSGHGGGVHAGRGADPAPGLEDGVLRLPGDPSRGVRCYHVGKVLTWSECLSIVARVCR